MMTISTAWRRCRRCAAWYSWRIPSRSRNNLSHTFPLSPMANIESIEKHLAATPRGKQILEDADYKEARERASDVGWLRKWIFNRRSVGIAALAGIAAVVVPGLLQRYGYTNNAYGQWASGAMDLTREATVNAATRGYNFIMSPAAVGRERGQNAANTILNAFGNPAASGITNALNIALRRNPTEGGVPAPAPLFPGVSMTDPTPLPPPPRL